MTEEDRLLLHDKEVEYFAACANAWFNTRLEFDKSILILASGGIAILIGVLTTLGTETLFALELYSGALVSFTISVGLVLTIYWRNATHIITTLSKPDVEESNVLKYLDHGLIFTFAVGIFFSTAFAVVSAYQSYETRQENKVAENQNSKKHPAYDSVHGSSQLNPKHLVQKSFQGSGALQPKATTQQQGSGNASTSAVSSSTASSAPPAEPKK